MARYLLTVRQIYVGFMSPPNPSAKEGGDGTTNQSHENNLAKFRNGDVIAFCPKMGAASWEAHKRLLDDARWLIGWYPGFQCPQYNCLFSCCSGCSPVGSTAISLI